MWIITKDKLFEDGVEGEKSSVGVCSRDHLGEGKNPSEIHKFRMLNGDGEVYYYGYSSDNNTEDAFAPLDDFGGPNDGCTEIQYYENGKWETL